MPSRSKATTLGSALMTMAPGLVVLVLNALAWDGGGWVKPLAPLMEEIPLKMRRQRRKAVKEGSEGTAGVLVIVGL